MITVGVTYSTNTCSGSWQPSYSAAASLNTPVDDERLLPLTIPHDQVYYWSRPWQEMERIARDDLAAGRSQVFADPADAVKYLFTVD